MKKTYRFTLPQNKEVESTNIRVENCEVFVDVELKDKFHPNDGDFLTNKRGKVFIYNGQRGEYLQYGAYCGTTIEDVINIYKYKGVCDWTDKEGCRFATPEEKAAFLERLENECHKRWNAETKQLEDIRWRAEKGKIYYYVSPTLKVNDTIDEHTPLSDEVYKAGNHFKTREAAQKVADQIKEIFKTSKTE